MAKVRVKAIGDQLLIVRDNKSADFYDKDRSRWSAVDGKIVFSYYELIDGNSIYNYVEKFSETTSNFSEPKEDSVTDLLISLNSLTEEVVPNGLKSTINSSTSTLAAGATFTGTGELNDYSDVMIVVKTDQDGTAYFEFSTDGTNWDSSISSNYHTSEINPPKILVKGYRYFRVRFTNTSASTQSYFRLGVYYGSFNKLTTSIDGLLPQNFDAIAVRPTDYRYEAALGNREGATTWNKWGYNVDVDTGSSETIWSPGGTFVPLTSASTLSFVSTSTADITSSGTGAQSIIVYGIDANRLSQTEVIQLNGVTPVVTTSTWLGINRLSIYLSGSGGVNAGKITATAVTGSTVQGEIPVGGGSSQQAIFFSQSDHQVLLDWLLINITRLSGGGVQPTVTIKMWVKSFVSGSKYEVFRYVMDTAVENNVELMPTQPFPIGEKSVVWIEATTDTNNTIVSARFSGIEVKNR